MNVNLAELRQTLPQTGSVVWIGVRPERRAPVIERDAVVADTVAGLEGDRYSSDGGKRQVTLIQHEHIAAIASLLHRDSLDPAVLRRNIVVRGINLLALKARRFRVGSAVLEYTGLCHPCSHMEAALGEGGYNAVRGHGGITARVVTAGRITLDDEVEAVE